MADAGFSGLAVTSIVTPAEGILVTFTVRPKSGPGAGDSVLLIAGVLVKFTASSPHPPSLLFEHAGLMTIKHNKMPRYTTNFFITTG